MTVRLGYAGAMLGQHGDYSITQGELLARLFDQDGYPVRVCSRHPNPALRLLDTVTSVARWGRALDVVLVDTYSGRGFLMAEAAAFVAHRFGLPVVHILHGGNLPAYATQHPRRVRRLFDRAARLVAPSSYMADAFAERGFRVDVIPNVIELEHYTFRARVKTEPRLLWMRSFHSLYAPELAVETLRILRRTHSHATLTMAGSDKGLLDDMRKLVNTYGLQNSVRFPGFLGAEAKRREFDAHDVFLTTNRVDNMPVSVIEAAASGIPIVAANVGGIAHLLENERTGLLVTPEEPRALAAAVDRLIGDPVLTQQLSTQGRLMAERFAWPAVRPLWANVFANVLQRS